MTGYISLMWTVWGVLLAILFLLYAYRVKLTRDEDDQIVLDDSFNSIRAEQAMIVTKVHKLEPVMRVAWILFGATSLMVLGYYVVFVLRQLQFL